MNKNKQKWINAALDYSAATGNTVVMLLKNATEVKWFHRYIWDKHTCNKRPGVDRIHFIDRRVNFVDVNGNRMKASAPFGSMIVVFQKEKEEEKKEERKEEERPNNNAVVNYITSTGAELLLGMRVLLVACRVLLNALLTPIDHF